MGLAIASVLAVLVAVGVIVAVKATGGGASSSTGREAAPANLVSHVTSVPLSTLTAAAAKVNVAYPPQPITDKPLTSGGKPEMLYIGAEFCPVCATERWPMVVALSHFGTFSNLSQTHSALADGNLATFSFYKSTFTSPYLTFTPVETTTNQPQGNYYKTLQTPTAAQMAIWKAHEGTNLSFPFVDIGGKYLVETAEYPEQALSGQSFTTIANSVGNNNTTIGANVDASAAVLIKSICAVTGQQPAATCSAVAKVPLGSSGSSGSSSTTGPSSTAG